MAKKPAWVFLGAVLVIVPPLGVPLADLVTSFMGVSECAACEIFPPGLVVLGGLAVLTYVARGARERWVASALAAGSIAWLFWAVPDEPIVFAVQAGPLYATTAESVTTCSEEDRVLDRHDDHQRDPAWSVDGRRLAYSRKIEGVWTMHTAGLGVPSAGEGIAGGRHWSSGGSDGRDERWPAWSPAGDLAYVVQGHGGQDTLRIAWHGSGYEELEGLDRMQRPHWSPDGRWVAFAREAEDGDEDRILSIWVVEVADHRLGEPTRLFGDEVLRDEELHRSDLNHPRWHPHWPVDDRIMFVHHRLDGALSTGLGVVSVSLERGELVAAGFRDLIAPKPNPRDGRLYHKEGPTEPTWSPDGTMIAYARERSNPEQEGSASLGEPEQRIADLMVDSLSALEDDTGAQPRRVVAPRPGTADEGCPPPGAPTWSPRLPRDLQHVRNIFSF